MTLQRILRYVVVSSHIVGVDPVCDFVYHQVFSFAQFFTANRVNSRTINVATVHRPRQLQRLCFVCSNSAAPMVNNTSFHALPNTTHSIQIVLGAHILKYTVTSIAARHRLAATPTMSAWHTIAPIYVSKMPLLIQRYVIVRRLLWFLLNEARFVCFCVGLGRPANIKVCSLLSNVIFLLLTRLLIASRLHRRRVNRRHRILLMPHCHRVRRRQLSIMFHQHHQLIQLQLHPTTSLQW
jgi:hypothetical protein